MWHELPIQINEAGAVLSDLDQHQLENMIRLSLSASETEIDRVRVEIFRLNRGILGPKHSVLFSTHLKNGYSMATGCTNDTKVATLVASVSDLKKAVEGRIRLESAWYFRLGRWIERVFNSFPHSLNRRTETRGSRCSVPT